MGKMKMEILGIDLSDKSTEELRKIHQYVGSLSEESVELIKAYDKDESIRRSWIEKPEETPLMDSDAEMICISHMNYDLEDPSAYFSARNRKNERVWALQVPEGIEYPNIYKTDFLSLNMGGVEHDGGDYVVCPDKNGEPDFSKAKAVNGQMFSEQYIPEYDKLPLKYILSVFDKENLPQIEQMNKDAIAAARMVPNVDADRMFTHFDSFYDSFEKAYPNIPTYAKQIIAEQTIMGGAYRDVTLGLFGPDKDILPSIFTDRFDSSIVVGGKLVFDQPSDIKENLGEYVQTQISDITEIINSNYGTEIISDKSITATPTIGNKFVVTFNSIPEDEFEVVSDAVCEVLSDKGYSDIKEGRIYPLSASELKTAKENYSKTALGLDVQGAISKYSEMRKELAHAEKVISNGFDDDGYNEDGFDETGHSKNGEYDSRYDKSFTDNGPDF